MTTVVEPLERMGDLEACERLQRAVFGDSRGASVLAVPALRSILESGGLLLGARLESGARELVGAVIDFAASWEGFPALFSHLLVVAREERNRGVGSALRTAERRRALDAGVEIIRAWVDPLRSHESHLLWNRGGAIGTTYERSALGELTDAANRGLATDRVGVEWWLRSPRTLALVEQGQPADHARLGFHEMTVATRTATSPSGWRVLTDVTEAVDARHVLVEIPVDVDALREGDLAEARRWRIGTRGAFERLLASGYLLVGLVHEGGRSFQLLEKGDRGTILGRG